MSKKCGPCEFCIWMVAALVMLPLWGAMTFAVLAASNAPPWAWAIFWMYLPLSFLFQIAAKIAEVVES